MSSFVLDTDHLTLLQHAHPLVRQRVAAVASTAIAVTIVTAEEQLRGWLDAIRRHNGSPRQIWAYQGSQDAVQFLRQVTILSFEQQAFDTFAQLRQQKIRIGSQDLCIAAITLAAGATLVTRNRRLVESVMCEVEHLLLHHSDQAGGVPHASSIVRPLFPKPRDPLALQHVKPLAIHTSIIS